MKLLIWSQHFWPENFGINQLAICLVKQGHEVTVLTGKPNYPNGQTYPGYSTVGINEELWEGMRIVRIPIMPRGKGMAFRLALNYLSFIVSGYVLAPFALRGMRFDAIFVYAISPLLQALPAIWMSWLKRAPLSIWVQDLWPESLRATGFVRNVSVLKAVNRVVRHIYRRSDSILIQSEAFRPFVLSVCGEPTKIHYFPNATLVSDADNPGGELPHSLQADIEGVFSIVFAGNIGRAQSVDTILAAAGHLANVPYIHFFIIGAGSETESMISKIASMHLTNICMTGPLPQSSMSRLFEAASVLLVTLAPNPALDATVPSKLQAYLAAGKPIIACMNGEGARIVEVANAGLTCPAGDSKALAASVLRLYKMTQDERHSLGDNGKSYANRYFDLNSRAEELTLLLGKLQRSRF